VNCIANGSFFTHVVERKVCEPCAMLVKDGRVAISFFHSFCVYMHKLPFSMILLSFVHVKLKGLQLICCVLSFWSILRMIHSFLNFSSFMVCNFIFLVSSLNV